MRSLSLLNAEHKLLEKLVMRRIHAFEIPLHESQSGFRPKMSALRSLLTIQLRIQECQYANTELHVCTFDVAKAFDRVLKAFLAQRLHQHMFPYCEDTARLAHAVMRRPVSTTIGNSVVTISTGAPQGSLLAPRGFIAADDDLGTKVESLGSQLVKYRDDNTVVSSSVGEADLAERTMRQHYAYSG